MEEKKLVQNGKNLYEITQCPGFLVEMQLFYVCVTFPQVRTQPAHAQLTSPEEKQRSTKFTILSFREQKNQSGDFY